MKKKGLDLELAKMFLSYPKVGNLYVYYSLTMGVRKLTFTNQEATTDNDEIFSIIRKIPKKYVVKDKELIITL